MSYEYRRTITDDEQEALLHYVKDEAGLRAELDRLITTGIAHTVQSYQSVKAEQTKADAQVFYQKFQKISDEGLKKQVTEAVAAVSISALDDMEKTP